jgi:hypothetical protein
MSDGWQTLASRVVYETAWMRIREDRLRQPSGALGVFSYVDKGPFRRGHSLDGERVYLMHQYRMVWAGDRRDATSLAALSLWRLAI